MTSTFRRATIGLTFSLGILAGVAHAVPLEITITNNQPSGGLFLTPLFTTFHNGTFDTFDSGSAASGAVQALAEEGSPAGLMALADAADVQNAVIASPGGFAGAPVIDPGETASIIVDVDPMTSQYFSFLSMVIPSNDAFIGNDNPLAYRIFNTDGSFAGLSPIEVLAGGVWDAGTEANTGFDAAFSTAGGPRTAENGVVTAFGNLSSLLNQNTVAGTTIDTVPSGSSVFATISIEQVEVAPVPLPAGLPLLIGALGLLGYYGRRTSR